MNNPNLSRDEIKNELINSANKIKVSGLSDPNDNFHSYISDLERIISNDKNEIILDLQMASVEMDLMGDNKQLTRGELIKKNKVIGDVDNMIISLENSETLTFEKLNKIEELYNLLEAASFEQVYDYYLESDKVNIELLFKKNRFLDSNSGGESTILKKRDITIFAKGGFKINTGVALTLNNFGSSSKDFFIDEDGIIGAEDNDYFTPNLSTMINFYPFVGENFNVGGAFGLSIPIAGDNNTNGLSFLLGPAIFIGNKSRLSLNGGVAYGPVKRLTSGYQLGDTTTSNNIENLFKSVYDFGYFFGISFSLFDIN